MTPVEVLGEIDSTNAEALRRAAAGARGPLWIRAERQTAGRGRRGRPWRSGEGDLLASLLIGPTRLRPGAPPAEWACLSYAAALALADALGALGLTRPATLKWPNDVLVEGRKIAGLLLEASGDALVIGVGLNLAAAPDSATLEPDSAAPTALAAHLDAAVPTPTIALAALDAALGPRLAQWAAEGFAPIRRDWLARAHGLGRPIVARAGSRRLEGVFREVDGEGALVLEHAGGVTRLTAAEVGFAEPGGGAPR